MPASVAFGEGTVVYAEEFAADSLISDYADWDAPVETGDASMTAASGQAKNTVEGNWQSFYSTASAYGEADYILSLDALDTNLAQKRQFILHTGLTVPLGNSYSFNFNMRADGAARMRFTRWIGGSGSSLILVEPVTVADGEKVGLRWEDIGLPDQRLSIWHLTGSPAAWVQRGGYITDTTHLAGRVGLESNGSTYRWGRLEIRNHVAPGATFSRTVADSQASSDARSRVVVAKRAVSDAQAQARNLIANRIVGGPPVLEAYTGGSTAARPLPYEDNFDSGTLAPEWIRLWGGSDTIPVISSGAVVAPSAAWTSMLLNRVYPADQQFSILRVAVIDATTAPYAAIELSTRLAQGVYPTLTPTGYAFTAERLGDASWLIKFFRVEAGNYNAVGGTTALPASSIVAGDVLSMRSVGNVHMLIGKRVNQGGGYEETVLKVVSDGILTNDGFVGVKFLGLGWRFDNFLAESYWGPGEQDIARITPSYSQVFGQTFGAPGGDLALMTTGAAAGAEPGGAGSILRQPGNRRAADRRAGLAIVVRAQDGTWQELGAGVFAPGIAPTGVAMSSDIGGSRTLAAQLARPGRDYPDLAPFSALDAYVAGEKVWAGEIDAGPESGSRATIQAVGAQRGLDDDLFDRMYVHRNLDAWRDARELVPTAQLAGWSTSSGTRTGGTPDIGWPAGYIIGASENTGIVLDLGPGMSCQQVQLSLSVPGTERAGGCTLYVRGCNDLAQIGTVFSDGYSSNVSTLPAAALATFGFAVRFVVIFVSYTGGAGTFAAPGFAVRVSKAVVFRQSSYRDPSTLDSNLTAATIIRDVRTMMPMLALDDSLIDPGGLATNIIREMAPGQSQTPREIAEAVNAYQGWRFGIDVERRMFFLPPSAVPTYIIPTSRRGSGQESAFSGLARASASDTYNRVIVEGTDERGARIREIVTAPSPLLDRLGRTKTARVGVTATSTPEVLAIIGGAWLDEKARTPLRGSTVVQGVGAVTRPDGAPLHPSRMLTACGERVRIGDLIDPDTGGIGRDGILVGVAYDHKAGSATLSLDNDTRRFDVLMSRFGVSQAR